MEDELLVTLDAGVLTLTLNRPERRNALSLTLYQRLLDELQTAAGSDEVKTVVLAGAGKAFCAGGDVARMADAAAQPPLFTERVQDLRRRTGISELLYGMRKPTIAKVRGPAVGAGLSLALACDLRIADTSARFATAFVRVGISGDFGGHYFLPRIVGSARARELYLTGRVLEAPEALDIGLVTRMVEPELLDDEVDKLARSFADGPSVAMGYIKDNLNYASQGASLDQVLEAECLHHVVCTETADHKEAASAFVEKRSPRFVGR